jgi:hypothetical protein
MMYYNPVKHFKSTTAKISNLRAKVAGVAASSLLTVQQAAAQATLPTEITELFVDTAAMAALVVTAGIVAYAGYRGGMTVLVVAKRMLGKAGL